MDKKNKNPAVRFKEFTDDWAEKLLADEVDFFTGLTYSPSNVVKIGGTLVLRSSNVKNSQIVLTDNVFVESEVVNCENVIVGDIIIVVRNGSRNLIGKHAIIKKNMPNTVIGAFMTGIHSTQSDFINSLLDTNQFEKEIEKNLGATINQITTGALKKMTFWFPKEDEQKQIGSFFQTLDNLITLHQRKYEKLVILKKAMLVKMFPKNGALVPEIRFKGFSGDWENTKIGENVLKTYPFKPFISNPIQNGIYEVIQQGYNPIIGYANGCPFHDFQKVVLFGDHTLSLYKPQKPFFVATDGLKILGNCLDLNMDYFYTLLLKNIPISQGYKRHLNILSDLTISITKNKKEQQKIGDYFKNLDNQIVLHKTQLEKLNNIKKACFSKMFVGQE